MDNATITFLTFAALAVLVIVVFVPLFNQESRMTETYLEERSWNDQYEDLITKN